MAPTNPRASSPSLEHADPVLAKLVETAKFDCDWPTLRHHLYLALLAALPVFLEKGKPVSHAGVVPIRSVSPTNTRAERSDEGHVLITPLDGEGGDPSLRPSTHGGLVIPPFPPLDPGRRRPHVMVINASEGRLNGTPAARGNPYEEDWDEEVIIGGRKLPGWFDEEEGQKEVDKVAQRIEELPFAPFTVQRLAELLVAPTKLHSTLGKFLRAVDKTLNVTTAYAPPSYTYVPPPTLPPMEGFSGSPSAAAASSLSMDVDSTVPPGSMTPMFSPIPFLPSGDESDALGEPMMDVDGPGDDGLMSPLMLSDSPGVFASQQAGGRSPTPEPEDEAEMSERGERSEGATASGVDPGNQPYLGRVDELDSGPLATNGHQADGGDEHATGVGEAGNMTPHGMSEGPVPLSSTTVIGDAARDIAPLPRRSESREREVGGEGESAEVKGERAGEEANAEIKEEGRDDAAEAEAGTKVEGVDRGEKGETEAARAEDIEAKEAKTE